MRNAAVLLMSFAAVAHAAAGDAFLARVISEFETASRQGRHLQAAMLGEGAIWLSGRIYKQPDLVSQESTKLLAEAYASQKHYIKAQRLYENLLSGREKSGASISAESGDMLMRLGDLHALQGKIPETESLYSKALDVQQKAMPRRDPRLTEGMIQIGNFYTSLGKPKEAEQLYKSAFDVRRQVFGEQDTSVSDASIVLADFYETQGDAGKAEQFYRLALSSQELSGARRDRLVGVTALLLARFYDAHGDTAASERFYMRGAVTLAQSYGMSVRELPLFGAASPDSLGAVQPELLEEAMKYSGPLAVAESLKNQAQAYVQLRMLVEARLAIEHSIAAYERALGADHPEFSSILEEHAKMLQAIGDSESAQALLRRALDLRSRASSGQ